MPAENRRISKLVVPLLLALCWSVLLVLMVPDVGLKIVFIVMGLFYSVAGLGIMRNRLWGFYISALTSIPGIALGAFRVGQVLRFTGSVDPGALYFFLLPSTLICACSTWMAYTDRSCFRLHT